MEKSYLIPTNDGHVIQTKVNSDEHEKVVVFAHGLAGSMREHHYFNAVPFFMERGFDVCRFNFYSDLPNARILSDCSLSIHALDLEKVIENLQKDYKKIYLIGHSLASPVILRSNLEHIEKVVLWDPTKSLTPSKQKNLRFCKELEKYIKPGRTEILLGKDMVKEWVEAANLEQEMRKITKPTKFIFAEKHDNLKAWLPFIEADSKKFEVSIVKEATHTFDSLKTERKLFEETLSFIA